MTFVGAGTGLRKQILVLFLGWRSEFEETLGRRGWAAIALRGPIEMSLVPAPRDHNVLDVYCDAPSDVDAILRALGRAGVDLTAIGAVCPSSEEHVVAAAVLSDAFGIPGLGLGVATLARDKSLQKDAVRRCGIATADATVIPRLADIRGGDWEVPFGWPAILKPVAGQGSDGSVIVRGARELAPALGKLLGRGLGNTTYIVERLIDVKQEWAIDGWVSGGQVVVASVALYVRPLISIQDGHIAQAVIMDSHNEAGFYEISRTFARKTVDALGMTQNVFHLEAFYDDVVGQLTFGEIAARPAGSGMPDAIKAKFGISLHDAHVSLCAGLVPSSAISSRDGYVGMTQLRSQPGILLQHPTTEEIKQLPNVLAARVQTPVGWNMEAVEDTVNARAGIAVVGAHSKQELLQAMDDVVEWCAARTVVKEAR